MLIELEERAGTAENRMESRPSAPKIKPIDRDQSAFVSLWVENLAGGDDKVRAIWDLTGRMDLSRLRGKIVSQEGAAGQAAEDPRLLVAIWVWSYSEGVSSSRQVEHLIGQEPALMWLCGLRTISHATLANFRKDHKAELDELFTQLLGMLETAGAVKLDRVMHDGTKIKAQAGGDTFRREGRLRANLEKARTVVEQMANPDAACVVFHLSQSQYRPLFEQVWGGAELCDQLAGQHGPALRAARLNTRQQSDGADPDRRGSQSGHYDL